MKSNISGAGHQKGLWPPSLKYLLLSAGITAAAAGLAAGVVVALNSGGPGKSLDGIVATSTPTPTAVVATATPYSTPTAVVYPTATATPNPTATATAVPSPTPTPTPPPTATATATPEKTTPTATATPIAGYTDEQLRQKLSGLDGLLNNNDPILDAAGNDSKGYLQKLQDIVEPLYFTATGKTFEQNGIEIHYFTRQQHEDFLRKLGFAVSKDSYLPPNTVVTRRSEDTAKDIKHVIIRVDYREGAQGNPPPEVNDTLASLVHELGHATAKIVDKDRKNSPYNSAALSEAQAYAFEAFAWRNAEQYLGRPLIGKKRATNINIAEINLLFDNILANLGRDSHQEGYLVPWLAVFEDPNLSDLKDELLANKQLSVKSSKRVFDHLMTTAKTDQEANDYVAKLMPKARERFAEIKSLASGRLISQNMQETGVGFLFYANIREP